MLGYSGIGNNYPSEEGRYVFSFDMSMDAVWVKQEKNNMSFYLGNEVDKLPIDCYGEWPASNESFHISSSYSEHKFYFDGIYAYGLRAGQLCHLGRDGMVIKEERVDYSRYDLWCWGDWYLEPVCFADMTMQFCGRFSEKISEDSISDAIARSDSTNVSNRKEIRSQNEQVNGLEENSDDPDNIHRLTLNEFRTIAPKLVGGREELLAYRKGLPQMWDYNAFVGILLGLHARKSGDIASVNFAFGQGDNNKSVDKRFDENGLWDIFYKYKKSDDKDILLSEVEDEIVSCAPSYNDIRKKFDEVLIRLLQNN